MDRPEDLNALLRFVYRIHLGDGLCHKNSSGVSTFGEEYNQLAETTIIVERDGETIIGTHSHTLDGPAGLPTDADFPLETQAIRDECNNAGKLLAVAWRLVVDPAANHSRAMLRLVRRTERHLREKGVGVLLTVVHPDHERFYARLFGCVKVAGPRACGTVCGRPGVLLRADDKPSE